MLALLIHMLALLIQYSDGTINSVLCWQESTRTQLHSTSLQLEKAHAQVHGHEVAQRELENQLDFARGIQVS